MRGCQFYTNSLIAVLSFWRRVYRQFLFLQFCLFAVFLGANSALAGREVFVPDESSYFNPLVGVRYTVDMGFVSWSDSTVLSHSECSFIYTGALYRICARMAKEGEYGNATGPSGCVAGTDQRQGAASGGAVCGRSQLCAYEDPQDGMDTQTYYNPFHDNQTNDGNLLNDAEMVAISVAGGAFAGIGVAMAYGIGTAYNHVVSLNLGCVDVPLATMPPRYYHDITRAVNSGMLPMVEPIRSNSVPAAVGGVGSFEAPRIRIVARENNIYRAHADLDVGGVCKELLGFSGRFCAIISTTDEMKVCAKEEGAGGRVAGCVKRPNPPKPVVTRVLDANYNVKLDVSLGNPEQKTSSPLPYKDPTATAASQSAIQNCVTLYGIPLCAIKKCSQYSVTPEQALVRGTAASCSSTQERVCLDGFKYGEFVVAQKTTGGTPGAFVAGAPNECRTVAGVQDCTYYAPVFDDPTDRHYVAPGSYRPSVTDLNINPYYVNLATQEVRVKNAEEQRLCVPIPKVFGVGANQNYTVPEGCRRVSMMVIGGGAAGDFRINCTFERSQDCDYSGGGGGFAQAELAVTPGDQFTVTVGAGGASQGAPGQESYVMRGGSKIIFANGGNKHLGGDGGGTLTGLLTEKGQNGGSVTCSTQNGGAARPSAKPESQRYGQPASVCSRPSAGVQAADVGAGGCASDDTCANSAWGAGGNGQVVIDCLESN